VASTPVKTARLRNEKRKNEKREITGGGGKRARKKGVGQSTRRPVEADGGPATIAKRKSVKNRRKKGDGEREKTKQTTTAHLIAASVLSAKTKRKKGGKVAKG